MIARNLHVLAGVALIAFCSVVVRADDGDGDEPKNEPKKDAPDEPKKDDKKDEASPDARAAQEKKKREAIKNGIDWLKKQQRPDGTWDYEDRPFALGGSEHLLQGSSALACFALLKAGVEPTDPVITKGFQAFAAMPIKHVYSAGCVLLAIDALWSWAPPDEDEPAEEGDSTREKKGGAAAHKKVKKDPRLLDLARQCVAFLEKTQQKGLWRYPMAQGEDVSNAQYALLGLDAAERIGAPPSKAVYEKALDYFVTEQEKDGPEVKYFTVPGAEHSFKELRAIEKDLRDKIHKIEAGFKGKKKGDVDQNGRTEEDQRRLAEEEASKRIYKTSEKEGSGGGTQTREKMYARGWKYMAKGGRDWQETVYGSMTASALACLFICKSHLDDQPGFGKLRKPTDKALRDGAAWLAKNFTVAENPGHRIHWFYYMYSMERGGILGLIPKFGDNDWYDEGVKMFIAHQKRDGSWSAADKGTSGPMPDTCFALLFLCRGTTPVVRIPERVITGQNGGAKN